MDQSPYEPLILLVRKWSEDFWNATDEAVAEQIYNATCSDSLKLHMGGGGGTKLGKSGVLSSWRILHEVIPNVRVVVKKVLLSRHGDKPFRYTIRYTMKGLSSDGKQIAIGGMAMGKIKDGKIVKEWSYSDDVVLAAQLGLIRSDQVKQIFPFLTSSSQPEKTTTTSSSTTSSSSSTQV